jgi:hypothetical protein
MEESVRPKFVGFSDSFVASVALRNDCGELLPIVTAFSAMSAAAVVILMSLASKHPLRGGIDVGLATETGPQEIYGTALERAYLLESQEAGYPRIVIGDELWRYFSSELTRFQAQTTAVAQALAAITQRMMGLIATDTDGNGFWIIWARRWCNMRGREEVRRTFWCGGLTILFWRSKNESSREGTRS